MRGKRSASDSRCCKMRNSEDRNFESISELDNKPRKKNNSLFSFDVCDSMDEFLLK